MKYTDKQVKTNIVMALSCYYSKNKFIKENSQFLVNLITSTLPEFVKLLNLPSGINFRVAPLKGRTLGRYNSYVRCVEVDCRLKWDRALSVIAHELVHAEQFHTGRLQVSGNVLYWNGEKGKVGATYKSYRSQPWEVEAYNRQEELAQVVNKAMEKKHAV